MGAVQDGVELRMADVHVLRVQRVALALPRHGIVIASNGHSVVAQGEDLVLGLTMQAPTWLLGSLERMAVSRAMPIKYSSQLM